MNARTSLLGLVACLFAAGCTEIAGENVGESNDAVTSGRIVVSGFEAPGAKLETWGYDIKQDGRSKKLKPAVAQEIFGDIGMNLLRVAVRAQLAHPTRGYANIVASAYADDLEAIANAKAVKADLPIFASVKLLGKESFPTWVEKDGEIDPAAYAELIEDYLAYMQANGVTIDWLGVDCERKWNEGNITPAKWTTIVGNVKTWAAAHDVKVPGFIAGEDYGPGDTASWTRELSSSRAGFGLANRVGVHTYSKHREDSYLAKLDNLVDAAKGKRLWDSELHWNDLDEDDAVRFDDLKPGMLLAFDHLNRNFESMTWWSFQPRSTGTKSAFVQSELVQTTVGSSMLTTEGSAMNVRAVKNDAKHVTLWIANYGSAESAQPAQIAGQDIASADYVQWSPSSDEAGTKGTAKLGRNAFSMDYPSNSITRVTVTLK